MPDRKISQLNSAPVVDYEDVIPIVHNGTTYNTTVDRLVNTGSRKILKNESFDADSRKTYLVNTAVYAVTATLPASPTIGDYVSFADPYLTWNFNHFTINNNTNMIHGHLESLVCNVVGLTFTLTYVGGTLGWRVD